MTILDTALRLINEHGVEVTISRSTEENKIDDVTGKRQSVTKESFIAYAVPTKDNLKLANAINGTASNERVFMLDSTVQPEIGDTLSIGQDLFKVKSFEIQYYKGAAVYYNVRVTK